MSFFGQLFGSNECSITVCTPSKKKKPKTYDFEYKVIERKTANGVSYYIGESTLTGRLQILTEDQFILRRYEADRDRIYMTNGGLSRGFAPVYKPKYLLMDAAESISRVVKHATFKDPCEVKELICRIRRENKEKATNLKYTKVVSLGECPCK